MSQSTKTLDQVLVEFPEGWARWMTPAQAWIIMRADPRIEIIDETSDRYAAVVRNTGPKPVIVRPPTEGLNAEQD